MSQDKIRIPLTRTGRVISGRIGKAIGDHSLIEDGDKILVGVSGGKDSLTLLKLLKARQSWAPVRFDILAAHVRSDFSCGSAEQEKMMVRCFQDWGVKSVFSEIRVLDDNQQTSCFWCSWNRRKALFELAEQTGCRKLALAHHKDDIIETVLMNLFFKGDVSGMQPRQEMFGGALTIIRPLCYVEEHLTRTFAREYRFLNDNDPCPFGVDSQRQRMKSLIAA